YLGVGAAALVVMGVTLWGRVSLTASLIPVFAGIAGVLLGSGPILVVTVLAIVLGTAGYSFAERNSDAWRDLLLCAAVLCFCVAHYRLQGLVAHLFPLDPRVREESTSGRRRGFILRRRWPIRKHRRSARLVTSAEWGGLVWLLLGCAVT